MIKLELRNTKTQKALFVDTRGAVFGREGGDADLQLPDQGVSKKHARIYSRKGEWFLEDLNSANGTYVDGQRISQPIPLEPGATFTLSRQQFEVVQVVEEEAEVTQAPRQDMLPQEEDDGGEEEEPAAEEDEPLDDEEQEAPPPARRPGASQAQGRGRGAPARAAARTGGGGGKDFGSLVKEVPGALAHYLAAIPLMLVNPIGFVNKSIAQQKFGPKGPMELIAWAFPPYAAYALLVFLGALLAQLAAGTVSVGAILPIGPIITMVVGSLLAGFLWHPVLGWIISKLGGESDEASRTHMFVTAMTTVALLGVPTLVGGVLAFIPVALLGLLPILLQAAVSLISLYTYYAWFRHLGVMRWFQYGLLVLAGLSVLGIVGSSLALISATLAGGSSGAAVASATSGSEGEEEIPAEWRAALASAEASGNSDLVEQVRSQMRDAMAAAKEGQQQAEEQPEAKQPEVEVAKATGEAQVQVQPASTMAPAPKETVKLDMPPPPAAAAAAPRVAPIRGTPYPEYKKKLNAIETAIAEDPTLLQRVEGLMPLYLSLHREQHQALEKMKTSQRKSQAWQSSSNAHLRDAEVYRETQDLVNKVHAKMFQ